MVSNFAFDDADAKWFAEFFSAVFFLPLKCIFSTVYDQCALRITSVAPFEGKAGNLVKFSRG